ncbi:MAG TPA: glycosyltransferase family 4 protein [Candidatus Nanoarchaeia archaeon]|nr:glycosyltransferase family 4 protein [Candidatus Nanoarchaeia archaeon]
MRIIVTTHDPVSPIRGGGGLRTLKTAIELKRRGHQVLIIAPSDRKEIDGIKIETIYHPSKEKSAILGSLLFSIKLFSKLLNHRNFDAFFVHNALACIPVTFFTRIFRRKVILDATDIHTEYMRVNGNRLLVGIFSLFEYWCFRKAKSVIVVSHEMKKHLVKKGISEKKISVVYDGVDVKNFSPKKKKSKKPIVIHHGGMDSQDGVPLIPKAAKYVDAEFLLIGSGQQKELVKKIIKTYSINNVRMLGWKPYSEMKRYLELAQIGVITRPDTLPNNLVLTLKLLEYWGSGTAVVSSRLAAIEEVSHEGEDILFFEPGNPKDLAQKIILLLNDKTLMKKLQRNGRIKSYAFDWKRLIPKIAAIVES